MSGFERGFIEPSNAGVSQARISTEYGNVSVTVTCLDADWNRWEGTYLLRIVNSTDLLLHARVRDAAAGVSVRAFCVFERTLSVPIPVDGVPSVIDVEGTGVAFSIDVPLPERGPQPHGRGTTTGTLGA
jgi:hypothetical protein